MKRSRKHSTQTQAQRSSGVVPLNSTVEKKAVVAQASTSSEVAKESKSVDQRDGTRWRRCEKAGKVGVQHFLTQGRLDVCETGTFLVA